MEAYSQLTLSQRQAEYTALQQRFEAYKSRNLKLNMARGKPGKEQLDRVNGLLSVLTEESNFCADGFDARNYGELSGLPAAKRLFAELLGTKPKKFL